MKKSIAEYGPKGKYGAGYAEEMEVDEEPLEDRRPGNKGSEEDQRKNQMEDG